MPSTPSRVSFVVDEAAFDSAGSTCEQLEYAFERLSAILQDCYSDNAQVGIFSHYWMANCCGRQVSEVLTGNYLSRDCRLAALSVLSKCKDLDDDPNPIVESTVRICGLTVDSFGLAYALRALRNRRAIGILSLLPTYCHGQVELADDAGGELVWSVDDRTTRLAFYRSVYKFENLPERDFFELADKAFPGVCFADGVGFRKFEGAYADLRDVVVDHLAVLSDGFEDALKEHSGVANRISAALGIEVSDESPNTRKSAKLMRQRDVVYKGNSYRCSWHSKLERHRNRIHFCLGDERTKNRLLIGMFVRHLDT